MRVPLGGGVNYGTIKGKSGYVVITVAIKALQWYMKPKTTDFLQWGPYNKP